MPQERVLQLLLDCGADPTVLDSHGRTPFVYAANEGYKEAAQLISDLVELPIYTRTD
jgi:hypothetical protein